MLNGLKKLSYCIRCLFTILDKAIEFGAEHEALDVDGVCVDEENKLSTIYSLHNFLFVKE